MLRLSRGFRLEESQSAIFYLKKHTNVRIPYIGKVIIARNSQIQSVRMYLSERNK